MLNFLEMSKILPIFAMNKKENTMNQKVSTLPTEQEIKSFILKHYKSAKVNAIAVEAEEVSINMEGAKMAFVAKRLIDKYHFKWVRFVGGWNTWIYSRETLKWAGYYNKAE